MRLVCPHCAKVVDVGDHLAGQTTNCSLCQGPFTVPMTPPAPPQGSGTHPSHHPGSFNLGTLPPPPPPPPPPDPLAQTQDWRTQSGRVVPPLHEPMPAKSSLASGWLGRLRSFSIPPEVCQWAGLSVLVLLFFLQFFTWVSISAGDTLLAAQSGVGMAFGSVSDNMKDRPLAAGLTVSMRMLLYFFATFAGLLLLLLVVIVELDLPALSSVRGRLERIAEWRDGLVLGLLVFTALILLSYVRFSGLPLEQSVYGDKAFVVMEEGLKQKLDVQDFKAKAAEMVPMQWTSRSYMFVLTFWINFLGALYVACRWASQRGYTQTWPKLVLRWPDSQPASSAQQIPADASMKVADWGPATK